MATRKKIAKKTAKAKTVKAAAPVKVAKAPAIAPMAITQVQKAYAKKKVLKDISLELKPGEIFGLIGLNGVGKTTLIKIILDLLSADHGEVKLFAQSHKEARARRHLCYLPEKFQPSSYLKGSEFISLSADYYRKDYAPKEAEAYAKKLDLDPAALYQKVARYSKGMGQKLGLISAFISKAPLLILDEPMSGLDPKARVYLKRCLKDYVKQGNTVFFSSHILADMEQICDRIAVLHGGTLVFTGTPAEFKKKYKAKGADLEETFLRAIEEDLAA